MGKLLDIAFYNPAQLRDEDFLLGFVARQELAEKILARLGEIKLHGLAQHRLILGQRGMGKTSLLRRIALGVRDTPALAATLIPLSFREEQYNVHNLHVFWCNCLDALGDWFEATGRPDQAERMDREVAALDVRDDDDEGSIALGVFRQWMKREGKRPLLLLDNIALIFDGLKDKQWSLRRVLQEAGGIVIIGATASFLEAAAKPEAAFYDFFQVDVLEKLSHSELLSCLRELAAKRGDAGQNVIRLLDRDPARIHALFDLTGGNPRTLAMIYLMLEMSDEGDVMRDLDRVLDQATPLYKARVEEFATQARVVFDAVALAWNPVVAADIATTTGLEVGAVSAQLDRLQKDGVLEKVSLSTTSRTAFQVAERFFNIWYLMRHGPRRQRSRLRWLAEILRRIYTPRQLAAQAAVLIMDAAGDRFTTGTYCLALSDAVDDQELRKVLRYEAKQNMEQYATDQGIPLEKLANQDEFFTPLNAKDWFEQGDVLHTTVGAYARAEAAYRKSIELDPKVSSPWNNLGNLLQYHLARYEEAEAAYRKSIELAPKVSSPWRNLGNLLQYHLARYEEAEAAYRKAIELAPKVDTPWNGLGNLLQYHLVRYVEAEAAYRKAIELDPKDGSHWNNLGNLLQYRLARYEEAEAAYRKAIELAPKVDTPWRNLGNLLQYRLARYEEAEAAYRKAIELDPKDGSPWNNLGNLMQYCLARYEEAEAAYRKAIELAPKDGSPWNGLGNLLQYHLTRHEEAEAAYRKAIDLDPKVSSPWRNLGNLLQYHLTRHEEAEAAYRKAIELAPKDGSPWNGLGNLLQHHLARYEEAEAAYRKAIELAPKDGSPWNGLGNLLQNHLARYEEAEAAYRKAIELAPKVDTPWRNLGNLLQYHLARYEEAEAAYRKSIELAPKDGSPWNDLGNLLQNHLARYEEAEAAYRKAIELAPKVDTPWNGLGNLLQYHLVRYVEAEAAYRKAIELDPKDGSHWNNLGNLLQSRLARYEEGEAAYRKAIELAPKDGTPWNGLGNLLQHHLARYEEAEAAYRKAIELDPKDGSHWNNLGTLLADHLDRPDEAEQAYHKAMESGAEEVYPTTNLTYLLLGQQERREEAESWYQQIVDKLPAHGAGLLRAFHGLAWDNFGAATSVIGGVLEEGHAELFSVFYDDLLRVLRLAAVRGYGDKLLAWLNDTGLGDRYWPLRAAFDAYLHGEARLMDVNPEVRGAARRIHAWLNSQPRGNADTSSPVKPTGKKPTRGRRKSKDTRAIIKRGDT